MNSEKLKLRRLARSRFFKFFEISEEFHSYAFLHLIGKLHTANFSFLHNYHNKIITLRLYKSFKCRKKSIYCCLTRFRSGFPKLFQVFHEFFSHASLYFMSHLLSFRKSFAFCVFHNNHEFSKNKKTYCSEYLTSEFIGYEKFKQLLRSSPDKFSYGRPKLGIFHIFSVAFPDVFFFHNNRLNINNKFNEFKVSFSFPSTSNLVNSQDLFNMKSMRLFFL